MLPPKTPEMIPAAAAPLEALKKEVAGSALGELAKRIGEIIQMAGEGAKIIGKEIDQLAKSLGLKPADMEMFVPGSGLPAEENFSDAAPQGKEAKDKITPEEEKDILGFLKKRKWLGFCEKACVRFGVPMPVLLGVIRCESGFRSNAHTYKNPDGKYASSARGLGQFLNRDWGLQPTKDAKGNVKLERRKDGKGFLNATLPENPWGINADRLNPEHAIWATARHIRRKVTETNELIEKGGFPRHFRLDLAYAAPENMRWIYMSYMNGAWGYLVLRRYLENPTPENYENLAWFQKRKAVYRNEKRVKRSHIEGALRCSKRGADKMKKFSGQIVDKNPAFAKIHLKTPEHIV